MLLIARVFSEGKHDRSTLDTTRRGSNANRKFFFFFIKATDADRNVRKSVVASRGASDSSRINGGMFLLQECASSRTER